MGSEPKGPYKAGDIFTFPGGLKTQLNDVVEALMNCAFKAGRDSRDGLREALTRVSNEPTDECGTCNLKGQIAKEALAEDEKGANEDK